MGDSQPETMVSRIFGCWAVLVGVLCTGSSANTHPLFSWTSVKGTFDNMDPKSASDLIEAKHKDFQASVVYLHPLSTKQLAMHKSATQKMQEFITNAQSSIFRPVE